MMQNPSMRHPIAMLQLASQANQALDRKRTISIKAMLQMASSHALNKLVKVQLEQKGASSMRHQVRRAGLKAQRPTSEQQRQSKATQHKHDPITLSLLMLQHAQTGDVEGALEAVSL